MNLIGRVKEVNLVREHLRAGRNLVVAGPAGVGKTALVTEAMAGARDVLYCADTSTLKTACESLLKQLGLSVAAADNIQRKRAILKATAGRKVVFVFDYVQRVTPKLFSLLDSIRESHRMIVVTRSLAWSDIGHLKMILWDFDQLTLANLHKPEAVALIRRQVAELQLTPPAPLEFERDLWRLSKGNPRLIVELCQQASKGRYVFGDHLSTELLDLDRRIAKLRPA